MYRQLQTHQALCIGHMILMHLSAIQLTLSPAYILSSKAGKSHALMKYSLKVGVAQSNVHMQFTIS